jgi:signal transduction histidine kinase
VRRRLIAASLAVTSTVVLAFLVPLALLVREVARDRALTTAERDAGAVIPVLAATTAPDVVESAVARTSSGRAGRLSVFLPDGTVAGAPATMDADVRLARDRKRAFSSSVPTGVAVFSPVLLPSGDAAVVRVLVPRADLDAGVTRSWRALAAVGGTLILFGVGIADRLARTVVAPVLALSEAAGRVAEGDLAARVSPSGPPEVAKAGAAFNVLADRIVELLAAERELVADLSHRLRTPVTALRLDAEAVTDGEQRQRVLDDLDGIEEAVSALIREARHPIRADLLAVCDVGTVLRDRTAFWSALADDQDRRWSLDVAEGTFMARTLRADLEAAVDALFGNVFAHTPEGAGFRVSVYPTSGRRVAIVIDDDGPGFVSGQVFERGRSGAGSTGLGLDIARRTASASGGSLEVSTRPGGGGRVVMTLALAEGGAAPTPRP